MNVDGEAMRECVALIGVTLEAALDCAVSVRRGVVYSDLIYEFLSNILIATATDPISFPFTGLVKPSY